MDDFAKLEAYYKKCIQDLPHCLPEGIVEVDLKLLQHLDLLTFDANEAQKRESKTDGLTRLFHVVESDEKITLINEQFVVWIVPENGFSTSLTHTMIALNLPKEPKLEMVFSVSGIYNTSKMVLRILERFLCEIQENEDELSRLKKAC